MIKIIKPLAFVRYMSRVPGNQISEFAPNRKWVKSRPEMGTFGWQNLDVSGFKFCFSILKWEWVIPWNHFHSTDMCPGYLDANF